MLMASVAVPLWPVLYPFESPFKDTARGHTEVAMARHPKERQAGHGGMTRREVLKRSAAASLALPGAAAILDACSKPGSTSVGAHANGPGVGKYWPAGSAFPLARQDA